MTKGKIPVPHFDYKARVDDYIKETLPELAAKTTFLMFGFYPSNFAFFPMLKPIPVVGRFPQSAQWYQTNQIAYRALRRENMSGCFQRILRRCIPWLVI